MYFECVCQIKAVVCQDIVEWSQYSPMYKGSVCTAFILQSLNIICVLCLQRNQVLFNVFNAAFAKVLVFLPIYPGIPIIVVYGTKYWRIQH